MKNFLVRLLLISFVLMGNKPFEYCFAAIIFEYTGNPRITRCLTPMKIYAIQNQIIQVLYVLIFDLNSESKNFRLRFFDLRILFVVDFLFFFKALPVQANTNKKVIVWKT